jgi:hypothetical protein
MAAELGVHASTVARHWQANGLKPHQVRGFKISRDPKFVEKLEDIVGLYMSSEALRPVVRKRTTFALNAIAMKHLALAVLLFAGATHASGPVAPKGWAFARDLPNGASCCLPADLSGTGLVGGAFVLVSTDKSKFGLFALTYTPPLEAHWQLLERHPVAMLQSYQFSLVPSGQFPHGAIKSCLAPDKCTYYFSLGSGIPLKRANNSFQPTPLGTVVQRWTITEYRTAAEQGNMSAQNELALMYLQGRGVAVDNVQAVYWFRKAAEQGHTGAAIQAASIYWKGAKDVPKDEMQAAVWFLKAAEQGDCVAQGQIGWMYSEGRGVTKDCTQAKFWFDKSKGCWEEPPSACQ